MSTGGAGSSPNLPFGQHHLDSNGPVELTDDGQLLFVEHMCQLRWRAFMLVATWATVPGSLARKALDESFMRLR